MFIGWDSMLRWKFSNAQRVFHKKKLILIQTKYDGRPDLFVQKSLKLGEGGVMSLLL